MYESIKKNLETLQKNAIILVITSQFNYQDASLFLIKYWIDLTKQKGVYVSLNRPYQNLVNIFNTGKIDTSRFFFIDCVSKNELDVPNCYFIKTTSLINVNLAISTLIKTENPSFIFLDSLNTLLLYNSLKPSKNIIFSLIQKLKTNNIDGIILAQEDYINKEILKEISKACDKTIFLTETTKNH